MGFAVCPVRVTRSFPWRRSRPVKQPARLTDECFCSGVSRRRATRHCGRVSLSAEQFAACFCRPLFSFRWQAQLLPSTMAGVQHGALKAIRKSDGSCLSFPLFVRATFARCLFFFLSRSTACSFSFFLLEDATASGMFLVAAPGYAPPGLCGSRSDARAGRVSPERTCSARCCRSPNLTTIKRTTEVRSH